MWWSVLCIALLTAAVRVASGAACNNLAFANPEQWGIDPQFEVHNTTLPADSSTFNTSDFGVCSYFAGQEVCCDPIVLQAINESISLARAALAVAQDHIAHEELFSFIVTWLNAFVDTPASNADIQALNTSLASLRSSQGQCISSLLAYSEGMMCFACSVDSAQFIDVANHAFLVSDDTCTGVVQACTPVFHAARNVIQQLLTVIVSFFQADVGDFDVVPDMCGGTVSVPGNCSEFICNTWIQGITIPSYSWNLPDFPNETVSLATNPRQFLASLLTAVQSRIAPSSSKLSGVQAGPRNVYVANGYPALAVGCASIDCASGEPQQQTSHTLAIGLGAGAGALVVIVLAATVLRRRARHSDGEEYRERVSLMNKETL